MVKGGKRQPKMRQRESGSFDPQVIGGFFSPTALLCSPLCEDISIRITLECPDSPVSHSAFYMDASIMVSCFIPVCYPSFHCPLLHILGRLFLVMQLNVLQWLQLRPRDSCCTLFSFILYLSVHVILSCLSLTKNTKSS